MPRSFPRRPPAPGPVPTAPLTQQQQLDLPRRLLAVLPEVAVDHLAALHGRLVLGAQCAAHGGRASPRPRRRGRLAARGEAGPEAAPLRPQLRQAGGKVCEPARRRPGRKSPPLRDQHLSPPQPPLLLLRLLLLPVAEPLQLPALASPASARRRGPAPTRPATTPRARSRPPSRARALGQRPLRRPRACVVVAPGASRFPGVPGARSPLWPQLGVPPPPAPIPHLLRSAAGISAYLSLTGADGTVAKVASKKRKAGLGI